MFGIGLPEMILILALALIVVGPDKLPELARSVAKGVLELKKTVSSLKESFADENPFDAVKPELEEAAKSLKEKLGDPAADGWKGILPEEGVNQADSGDKATIVENELLSEKDKKSLEAMDIATVKRSTDSPAPEQQELSAEPADEAKEDASSEPAANQDGTISPSR